MTTIVVISDDLAANRPWLLASESLHRQLRPNLPLDYPAYMERMFAEGAGMAVLFDKEPRALAVFRSHLTTFRGRRFYVDDLVTDEASRSKSYGGQLIAWCETRARETGCDYFDLESGVQRQAAHRFYFRHGLTISSFGFSKKLT